MSPKEIAIGVIPRKQEMKACIDLATFVDILCYILEL